MKRILSVALGRHLFVFAGLALVSTVGNLLAADTYYVSDHLATTTAVADAAGEIASIEADAFGSPVGGAGQSARYTGKPYDADIGAYVFPFRNYRSDEARWMSADPSGFPDGVNASAYMPSVNSAVDTLGLFTLSYTGTGTNQPATDSFSSGGNNYTLTARRLDYVSGISSNVLGILATLCPSNEGWNFNVAGSRSGTVTVSDYSLSHSSTTAGASLTASYSGVASGAPSSSHIEGYNWIQLYQENGGAYVVDAVNAPANTPFYMSGFSTGVRSYFDAPHDVLSNVTPTSSVNLGFLTFLVDWPSSTNGTVNIYDGFTWGYTIRRE